MQKNNNDSRRLGKQGDLVDEVKQYLELSENSSGILKFLSDAIEENPLYPERDTSLPEALESLNRSSSHQDGRAPSPASVSSLTSSRRLEWDSGADVGYQQSNVHPSLLSTLERMALDGCTESLIRTDPEGTNSCLSTKRNPLHKSVVTTDSPAVRNVKESDVSVSSPREVAGVINLPVFANNEAVGIRSAGKISPEGGSRKNSTIVSGNDTPEVSAELIVVGKEVGDAHSSNGHSKVDSPVDDHILSEKNVPLAPLASVVAANSASSSSLASTIVPHNTSDALTSGVATTVDKLITRGIQVGGTLKKYVRKSETSSVKNGSGSEDEIRVLIRNGCPSQGRKISLETGIESLETSSFDCAHSFEYFPGEAFDKDSTRRTKSSYKMEDMQSDRINTSLSKDLDRNIGLIREILSRKKTCSAERKALVKQLVDRIVGTEYVDDDDKNSSDKSSVRVTESPLTEKEQTAKLKADSSEKINLASEKSFVPYQPVPGGRLYHVASQTLAKKDYRSNSSCYESDDSKPKTCYLPVDRIKITQQSSSSSEIESLSPVCVNCLERRNSELRHLIRMGKIDNQRNCDKNFATAAKYDPEDEKPCCSRECRYKRNWWSPVTKSEKKHLAGKLKSQQNPILAYMEHEKANQLKWIKNEIKHLTNLAQLLEECSAMKSDSPASLEEQVSLLSSINKKVAKNVANASDKFLSSARSTPVEEPITATVTLRSELPKKKPSRPISPPSHDTSEDNHIQKHGGNNPVSQSDTQSSYPSRSSSRNLNNSDVVYQPKMHGRKHAHKDSEAYVITFEEGSPNKREKSPKCAARKPLKEVRLKVPVKLGKNVKESNDIHCWTSLQEQLEVHHPDFIKSSLERQKCLEELARLRSLRQMTRRKLLHCTLSTWEDQLNCKQSSLKQNAPKPRLGLHESVKPSSKVKDKHQQPCSRLKRRHRVLPEAQKKEAERKKKQYLQTNRIMAEIYSQRLQKKVLSGAVSLSNSVSVISSL